MEKREGIVPENASLAELIALHQCGCMRSGEFVRWAEDRVLERDDLVDLAALHRDAHQADVLAMVASLKNSATFSDAHAMLVAVTMVVDGYLEGRIDYSTFLSRVGEASDREPAWAGLLQDVVDEFLNVDIELHYDSSFDVEAHEETFRGLARRASEALHVYLERPGELRDL